MEKEKSYGKPRPSNPERDLQRMLRSLKKDFQKEVMPSTKRKKFHMSKSELNREKARKAARRRKKEAAKARER
jgi:hypothetical protein